MQVTLRPMTVLARESTQQGEEGEEESFQVRRIVGLELGCLWNMWWMGPGTKWRRLGGRGFGIDMGRDHCCVSRWGPVYLPRRPMAGLEKYYESETRKVG